MKSLNFEFLRSHHPEMADLGGVAESYVFTDPHSASLKIRALLEILVKDIYRINRFYLDRGARFVDWLTAAEFESAVSASMLDLMHTVRKAANKQIHSEAPKKEKPGIALNSLSALWNIARWYSLTFLRADKADLPNSFQQPHQADPEAAKAIQKTLEKTIKELEARNKAISAELDREVAKNKGKEHTSQELQQLKSASDASAGKLGYDEAETRIRLVDKMISKAGWELKNKKDVTIEEHVDDQPTKTGSGYVDYVLWDTDGKPLAVVEAKRVAVSAAQAREQAMIYAESLHKEHGVKPFVFYSNGIHTYFYNWPSGAPPRRVYGIYSRESLRKLRKQVDEGLELAKVAPNLKISDRPHSLEAIKRVTESLDSGRRKALIALATGTGKTRVAISIADIILNAHWGKRILFLCDRVELREQAASAFKRFLPDVTVAEFSSHSKNDKDTRIFVATYPSFHNHFENFDIGHFDLIICDEAHRSVYNKYADIFLYFDAIQIGLTATPIDYIDRNTFDLFNREGGDPTAKFTFEDAINAEPPALADYVAANVTTNFQRKGIRYSEMSEDQKREAEDKEDDASTLDIAPQKLDKAFFNEPTHREMFANLMKNGHKVTTTLGTHIGKTIVFARSQPHAESLQKVFEETYPSLGAEFSVIIHSKKPRAKEMLKRFKKKGVGPWLAISVDMLDTGIDVPEIVNLVFAKPVGSIVKFWQMIGRGTRLCDDIGDGTKKDNFLIFDHWGNFDHFGVIENRGSASTSKGIAQRLFEARLALAEYAIAEQEGGIARTTLEHIRADLADLPEESIRVQEHLELKLKLLEGDRLERFEADTLQALNSRMAGLMDTRALPAGRAAYKFDLLCTQTQLELLKGSSAANDRTAEIQAQVARLPITINQVAAKEELLKEIRSKSWPKSISAEGIEEIRIELRELMQYLPKETNNELPPRVLNLSDGDLISEEITLRPQGFDCEAFYERAEKPIQEVFDSHPTIEKVRKRKPVSEKDLRDLGESIQLKDPNLDVHELIEAEPNQVDLIVNNIRQTAGCDKELVHEIFNEFLHDYYSRLSSTQLRFLDQMKQLIARYGYISDEQLQSPPLSQITTGVDALFEDQEIADRVYELIDLFKEWPPSPKGNA